jgi:hypothetical protein
VRGPNPKPTMLTRRTLLAAVPITAVAGSAALRPVDPRLPRAIGRGPGCSPPKGGSGGGVIAGAEPITGYSSARLQGVAGSGIHVGGNPLSHPHILRPVVDPVTGLPLGSVPGHSRDNEDGTVGASSLGRSPALILTTAGIFEG